MNNLFITITLNGRTYNHSALVTVGDESIEDTLTEASLLVENFIERKGKQKEIIDSVKKYISRKVTA